MNPADMASAVAALRQRADDRWIEVANDVLENALRASRGSMPVRAHSAYGELRVSEQVIITYLRRRIDEQLVAAAVGRVIQTVNRDEELQSLTIELFAQFGAPLLPLADRARDLADGVLLGLLGPHPAEITMATVHVHFSQVTQGDPHLEDPTDL